MTEKKIVLVVEDDDIDAKTIIRAYNKVNPRDDVVHKKNGEEALAFLRESTTLPKFILLDINMPKMNGLEFLAIIRKDKKLERIPVIVLTTSQNEKDRYQSFTYGVAGYMIKPLNSEKFIGLLEAINLYWSLSELPD